jgi:hypothetical protein
MGVWCRVKFLSSVGRDVGLEFRGYGLKIRGQGCM